MPPISLALGAEALEQMDAYWRAANYLSAGPIYLLDNPLLKEPLTLAHIRQRMRDKQNERTRYVHEHGEDLPEIRNWKWLEAAT